MFSWIKSRILSCKLFNFNLLNRDAWIMSQAARLKPGSVVLDAGAGSCPYREWFAHCEYRTQDFTSLENTQLRHGGYGDIDYVCDASEIPVPDHYFDAVLCTEVLEHVPEPVNVIREFSRILKPGGKLILTAPLGSGIHQEPYHFVGGYTPFWYERFLGEAGFTEIDVEANAGTFKAFSQESLRVLQLSRPFRLGMPLVAELAWLPAWLVLVPVLALIVPIMFGLIDRYDREQRFTVGYHVTAVKKPDAEPEK